MVEYVEEPNKGSFENLKDSLADLVLTIDRNNTIIKVNSEFERISGYSENEIINQQFFELLISDKYNEKWEKILDSVRRNKLIDDFELPLLTLNGNEVMISWSSFPVKNSEGIVTDIGLVGTLVASWDDAEPSIEIPPQLSDNSNFFDDFERVVKDLEKKNSDLENKNKDLERKLDRLKGKKSARSSHEDVVGKGLYRVSDVIGGKKQKEEIHALMIDLDEREKRLNRLGSKLEKEKMKLNARKNEFIRWREKLETLESDVESRKKWVVNKEKALKKFSSELKPEDGSRIKSIADENIDVDMFNQIKDCAAIIQRGVFKQVNSSFTELLGYNVNEILDKSIFDFIEPEGLRGIEQYFFERLKGEDVTDFGTIFLTKDNVKVSVEVSTQPTVVDGEKAEIVVFKKLKIKKE